MQDFGIDYLVAGPQCLLYFSFELII